MSEKDKHIDWMNEQDAALTREAKQHDYALEERVALGSLIQRRGHLISGR